MSFFIFILLLLPLLFSPSPSLAQSPFSPTKTYKDSTANNQDDMAIWIHPSDKAKSLIIGSDKINGNVYVYDLSGTTLQKVTDTGGQPGGQAQQRRVFYQDQDVRFHLCYRRKLGCAFSFDAWTGFRI